MTLNGSAIRRHAFRKKLQGFDPAEVARFLEEVAAEIDRLAADNAGLERKTAELETQLKDFRSVEKALQQTLAQAQDSTARAIEQARKEAQLIIQDAEMKGAQIVEKSRGELAALKEQVTILAAKKDSIVGRLRMLLTSELETVKALEASDGPARTADAEGADEARDRPAGSDEIDEIVRSLDRQ